MTDAELRDHAEWVKRACLAFGSSVSTAYTVAGVFAKGLEDESAAERGPSAASARQGE